MTKNQPPVDTFTTIHNALRNGLNTFESKLYRFNVINNTQADC